MEPFGPMTGHVGVHGEALEAKTVPQPPARDPFEALYADYRMPMVRLAHVITGSNEVAEEIVQEAFVRLHRRFAAVENPPAFLRTIVTNLCRSEVRRARISPRRVVHTIDATGDPEIDETWSAVRRLPSRQRAVLALRYYADLPEAEIARVLGCRLGTVKSAHHRALAKLRDQLGVRGE
jgi:RNA polymerase sigma-70 factor (sigma-E family)